MNRMSQSPRTSGAKAQAVSEGVRGPEGPLFHGDTDICNFFRQL